MAIECDKCVAIKNLEYQLDRDAADLQDKVDSHYSGIVSENNKRWEEYASKCNIPIIGSLYQKICDRPRVLIGVSPFYNDMWFSGNYAKIQKDAELLEELKKNDMGHWGNEMVCSGISGDPQSGAIMTRKKCYNTPDRFVFVHNKYNRFYPNGELVMNPETRKLVLRREPIDRS